MIPEPINRPGAADADKGKKDAGGALALSRTTAAPVNLVVYRAEAGRVFLSSA